MKRELVEAARRGDRDSFDALVRAEIHAVYRTAVAILGVKADAEDAVQETFVAAWKHLPALRDVDRFDAWIGRITVNACRMALRRRPAVREISLERREASIAAPIGPDPLEAAAEAEAFDRAFEQLSVDDRALLILHYRDGLLLADIGERVGLPIGTVKSRLFRARRSLERLLDPGVR